MKKKTPKKPQVTAKPSFNLAPALSICVILAGALILYLHPLNNLFKRYYLTNIPLDLISYPGLFETLNRVFGAGLIVTSVLYLLYNYRFKKAVEPFLTNKYETIIVVILTVVSLVVLLSCYYKYFTIDEIEHIHSTWYVEHGYIPYTDFFQHHNPLLWYLLTPFLYLFGDSTNALLATRLFVGTMLLGIAYFTFLITVVISKSKEMGLISVVILSSSVLFIEKGIEIRPDVPEVLFGMASVYLIILFARNKNDRYLFLSGLSTAISFLFLQKTIFLLISYAVIFAYAFIKKEIRVRSAFYFIGGFLLPMLIFLGYLFLSGSFNDYILTNWRLNMRNLGAKGVSLHSFRPLVYSFSQNLIIWFIAALAVIFSFMYRKTRWEIKMVTFLGLFQLLTLMFYTITFKHYYLFAIPLLCVTGAYCFVNLFERYKINKANRLALLTLLIFTVTPFLSMNICRSNRLQMVRLNYFLRLTNENDLVYDGLNSMNIFRRDVHYYWFQLNSIPKYNELTNNKYEDYDICSIIWSKKPKITTDFGVDFKGCGLQALYNPTRYPHFYIRKEEANAIRR